MTIGYEMKKPEYLVNLITTNPRRKTITRTTTLVVVALGDPFQGPKNRSFNVARHT